MSHTLIALELNTLHGEKINNFIDNKNIIANIYRIKAYDFAIVGYFCIGFIDLIFVLDLLDFCIG